MYTKKDLASSPVATRSRRKTATKTSPEKVAEPLAIEIETVKTTFSNEEDELIEKEQAQENFESNNVSKSSEHRFEDDEIEDTKRRQLITESHEIGVTSPLEAKVYNSGYLMYTTGKVIRLTLITILCLVVLAFLNNTKRIEPFNKLTESCPLFRSVQNNVNDVSTYLIDMFNENVRNKLF